MDELIIINVYSKSELPSVIEFNNKFSYKLRIVSAMPINFGTVWKVPDSDKSTVEWSRRFLRKFMDESYDVLIKIDPDTIVKTFPEIPCGCDVAGDFRKTNMGWVWFGGCQYFTRNAIEKILADDLFNGYCKYQDIQLAKSVQRLGLKAYNMNNIDAWNTIPSTAAVIHKGRCNIVKLDGGLITLTK